MSEQVSKTRIYTNDLMVERARQEAAAAGENRLQELRNRIARGKTAARVLTLALVAKERGDGTVEKDARDRLVALGIIEKGAKLTDLIDIVPSRRASRSKTSTALGLVIAISPEAEEVAAA